MERTIFRIWDTVEEDFWSSHTGKDSWLSQGAAKGSWNYDSKRNWCFSSRFADFKDMNFDDQDRFIVQEYELVLKLKENANT